MTTKQDKTTTLCPPRHYKGIEFINYSDLSHEELVLLRKASEGQDVPPNNMKRVSFETVSIMIDGKIVQGCILYKDYLQWRVNSQKRSRS